MYRQKLCDFCPEELPNWFIGIVSLEYIGIEEFIGITYKKKNAYNI